MIRTDLQRSWLLSTAVETQEFDYILPEEAIAQTPREPRDAARLLRSDNLEDRKFSELPALLHPNDLLVVNRTRVRAARLRGHKSPTGGAIELLLTRRLDEGRWEALIRPSRRVRAGTHLDLGPIAGEVITDPKQGEVVVALKTAAGDVERVIEDIGVVPLPPYIHEELSDPERYQTVFADTTGSAAAPTAALHFTTRLRDEILAHGVHIAEVELQVGLDTFRPIATDRVSDHEMHREWWQVSNETEWAIAETRKRAGRVIAVGTTVVRTLESAATTGGLVAAGSGETDLFIAPGYRLRVVDAVLTNFHAPRTTLIVMIATILGPRWREVYRHALDHGYRFLSCGDAMFIESPVNQQ